MRTISSLIAVVAATIFLVSCSGNIRVEKRHYRSGWYVSSVQKQGETKPLKEQEISTQPLEPVPSKKVFAINKSDGVPQLSVPSIRLKEEKKPVAEKAVSEKPAKANAAENVQREKNVRPGDDDKAARNKTVLVSVLASLSAVCILLGLILLSTGMLPLFMIFAVLLAIAALGIHSEKKRPERHPEYNEPSSQNPSGMDKGEQTFFLLLAGFFALVIIGLGALLLLFLDLLGGM